MLHVQFTGRLGADAETKKINDTTVTNFSVATDESFEKDAPAIWLRCALWGKRGETLSEFLEPAPRRVPLLGEYVSDRTRP